MRLKTFMIGVNFQKSILDMKEQNPYGVTQDHSCFHTKICISFPSVSQGTTGSPKAVVLSYYNVVNNSMMLGRRLETNLKVSCFIFLHVLSI
jgi:long-subunit acyl-CoA synthetase (AMP-forming)